MTTQTGERADGLRRASMALAIVALVVVVWSFFGSGIGQFLALGAYAALPAFAVAAWNWWRRGDRSRLALWALIVATVALVLGLAILALGIGLMGVPTLWFSGSG